MTKLAELIHVLVIRTYNNLTKLLDRFPDETDEQRKIRFLDFFHRSRSDFTRLLVLVKWIGVAPELESLSKLQSALTSCSQSIEKTAEQFYNTHQMLNRVSHMPFDIVGAIDILSGENTSSKQIRALLLPPQEKINQEDKDENQMERENSWKRSVYMKLVLRHGVPNGCEIDFDGGHLVLVHKDLYEIRLSVERDPIDGDATGEHSFSVHIHSAKLLITCSTNESVSIDMESFLRQPEAILVQSLRVYCEEKHPKILADIGDLAFERAAGTLIEVLAAQCQKLSTKTGILSLNTIPLPGAWNDKILIDSHEKNRRIDFSYWRGKGKFSVSLAKGENTIHLESPHASSSLLNDSLKYDSIDLEEVVMTVAEIHTTSRLLEVKDIWEEFMALEGNLVRFTIPEHTICGLEPDSGIISGSSSCKIPGKVIDITIDKFTGEFRTLWPLFGFENKVESSLLTGDLNAVKDSLEWSILASSMYELKRAVNRSDSTVLDSITYLDSQGGRNTGKSPDPRSMSLFLPCASLADRCFFAGLHLKREGNNLLLSSYCHICRSVFSRSSSAASYWPEMPYCFPLKTPRWSDEGECDCGVNISNFKPRSSTFAHKAVNEVCLLARHWQVTEYLRTMPKWLFNYIQKPFDKPNYRQDYFGSVDRSNFYCSEFDALKEKIKIELKDQHLSMKWPILKNDLPTDLIVNPKEDFPVSCFTGKGRTTLEETAEIDKDLVQNADDYYVFEYRISDVSECADIFHRLRVLTPLLKKIEEALTDPEIGSFYRVSSLSPWHVHLEYSSEKSIRSICFGFARFAPQGVVKYKRYITYSPANSFALRPFWRTFNERAAWDKPEFFVSLLNSVKWSAVVQAWAESKKQKDRSLILIPVQQMSFLIAMSDGRVPQSAKNLSFATSSRSLFSLSLHKSDGKFFCCLGWIGSDSDCGGIWSTVGLKSRFGSIVCEAFGPTIAPRPCSLCGKSYAVSLSMDNLIPFLDIVSDYYTNVSIWANLAKVFVKFHQDAVGLFMPETGKWLTGNQIINNLSTPLSGDVCTPLYLVLTRMDLGIDIVFTLGISPSGQSSGTMFSSVLTASVCKASRTRKKSPDFSVIEPPHPLGHFSAWLNSKISGLRDAPGSWIQMCTSIAVFLGQRSNIFRSLVLASTCCAVLCGTHAVSAESLRIDVGLVCMPDFRYIPAMSFVDISGKTALRFVIHVNGKTFELVYLNGQVFPDKDAGETRKYLTVLPQILQMVQHTWPKDEQTAFLGTILQLASISPTAGLHQTGNLEIQIADLSTSITLPPLEVISKRTGFLVGYLDMIDPQKWPQTIANVTIPSPIESRVALPRSTSPERNTANIDEMDLQSLASGSFL